ncbi:MAG: Uma2 family endonuclease [Thermomicrobiales bacterium]
MSAAERLATYWDLLDTPDDGMQRQIIAGEMIVTPAPLFSHLFVQTNLQELLAAFLRETGVRRVFPAPADVCVGPYDVVQPDLMVLEEADTNRYLDKGVVDAPPIIVVEVLSPSTARVDRVAKAALYARFGVQEYWIVDPSAASVEVFSLTEGMYQPVVANDDGSVNSEALHGFVLRPAEIFSMYRTSSTSIVQLRDGPVE